MKTATSAAAAAAKHSNRTPENLDMFASQCTVGTETCSMRFHCQKVPLSPKQFRVAVPTRRIVAADSVLCRFRSEVLRVCGFCGVEADRATVSARTCVETAELDSPPLRDDRLPAAWRIVRRVALSPLHSVLSPCVCMWCGVVCAVPWSGRDSEKENV